MTHDAPYISSLTDGELPLSVHCAAMAGPLETKGWAALPLSPDLAAKTVTAFPDEAAEGKDHVEGGVMR